MAKIEYKHLTASDIEALHEKMQVVNRAKKLLEELLVIGRQCDFWKDVDQYCKAKRVTLDYIANLRRYRKDLLAGLYKHEGEYKKSNLL